VCSDDRWRHHETDPSEGTARDIPFDFYWLPVVHPLPTLNGERDALLPELMRRLALG